MVTRVKLSVREFALPAPLTGSIESDSGYHASSEVGIEIHSEVQERRRRAYPNTYSSEVKIEWVFTRDEFEFHVDGRMDGIFSGDEKKPPKIEEIKSTFSLYDLHSKLKDRGLNHPYTLQLLTYGYLYEKNHEVRPDLSFHLVSSRNRDDLDLSIPFDLDSYEQWLNVRLDELVAEAKRAVKRMKRRKKLATELPFPFKTPRKGQMELIQTIDEGFKLKERMLLQAPTGLGKTVGVLYPTLKEALARGKSVIYVTPKNSQHKVAEDAVERFQEEGAKLKSLTFTAKQKCCLKPEPLCNPGYCEYAKDYYDKLAREKITEQLAKIKSLTAKTFKALGEKYEVCPFELQLEAVEEADVVICDYNYVFSNRSALKRAKEMDVGGLGLRNLVIDEAHNLPSRAMSYYSPELTVHTLTRFLDDLALLPKRYAKEGVALAAECIAILEKLRPAQSTKTVVTEINPEPFREQDGKLRSFLTQYLESDVEIESRDPVLGLSFYWSEFTEMLEWVSGGARPEFFTLYLQNGGVKVSCADASEMLKDTYAEFEQVVGFSATLKPFDYYSKLSGLAGKDLKTAEFESPFDHSKRKILIIPQISTKYQERARNFSRIAETIERVSQIKHGNHLAFFPSFDFLRQVAELLKVPEGYRLLIQERNTTTSTIEDTMEQLRNPDQPVILFAVQGGVYSEGVDYPGDMAIGVFVVGPPLPTFDVEREKMREYYEKMFSAGFDYAYTYPAMSKAIQAAGRVIRNENDKGIIVLMDSRFLDVSYSKSMPADWFLASPRELVSTQILKDLSEFWN
jgi:DNA excision repair protein ERCC-2